MKLRIKEFRKRSRMTQEELAAKAFVSQSIVAKFETGIKDPSLSTAKRIADVFGVKIDDLIESEVQQA